jgi:hypothetical protein
MITQKRLKELIHYDPKTGIVTNKLRRGCSFPGKVLGCSDHEGYLVVSLDGKNYKLHRLLFLYMEGYVPENSIDHINRNVQDNSWKNLRETSTSCNARNAKVPGNNCSGIVGVCLYKNKWIASIGFKNKSWYLGIYKDFDEAVCMRLAAEQCLSWEGCDSTSTAYKYVTENRKNWS